METEVNMEEAILLNLVDKPGIFFKTVIPFMKSEYFNSIETQEIYNSILNHYNTYSKVPTKKELVLSIKNNEKIKDTIKSTSLNKMKDIYSGINEFTNNDYLLSETEKWIQKAEFTKAILTGVDRIKAGDSMSPVYDAFGDALKISFDSSMGSNIGDIDAVIGKLQEEKYTISTGVDTIDGILGGGFTPSTLNVIASQTHGGKSALMASMASSMLLKGYNTLFVTLEMSEEQTLKRIYSNILNININQFKSTNKSVFQSQWDSIVDSVGDLQVKEFPTGTLTTMQLENYVEKLENSTGKKIDAIFVDYLTIMNANSVNQSIGSYGFYKIIAEELRSMSQKLGIPIITAQQMNRSGFNTTEAGLESVGDSLAIAQTSDTFMIINRTEDLDNLNQISLAFKKNRNTGNMDTLVLNVDYEHMRYASLGSLDGVTPPQIEQKANKIETEASNLFGDVDFTFD